MVTRNNRRLGSLLISCAALVICLLLVALTSGQALAAEPKQKTFASPEEAVKALVAALKAEDTKALSALFGPGSKELVSSGDAVADKARRDRFVSDYESKNKLEEAGPDKVVLYVGNQDWPFPIPVVKAQGAWRFAAKEGQEEILARRIGGNELGAIQVCLAYVDAQREYVMKDHDSDGLLEYAQKFWSDAGKKNGLYWETKAGDEQSPFGPLVGGARKKGYTAKQSGSKPAPYFGYYYRILTGQGKSAPGGAYDYVVKGNMIGGFALVAYPAQYGASGIMTFMVNHDGVVYQKDLGKNTEKNALAMKLFNPDSKWKKVEAKAAQGK